MTDFSALEKRSGYVFKDKELLEKALTLSSYDSDFNNQSLECMGDALLSFIVAEKYYGENADEGQITAEKQRLLSDEALAPVSKKLGLDKALIAGKGDTHNKKAVPSAYEAFVAAIYLDGGLQAARKFALSTLTPLKQKVNPVVALQELLQARGEQLPEYEKRVGGTPQKPLLTVRLKLHGRFFTGEGESFAKAKRKAAQKALEFIK